MRMFNSKREVSGVIGKGYHYESLPDHLKKSYEDVADGIQSFQKKIQLNAVKDKRDIERVVDAFIFDNPQVCYFNPNEYRILPSPIGQLLLIEYIYDKKKAAQVQTEINEKADFIISQFITDDMDDYEICLSVHDYMTENIRYNFSALSVDYVYDAFTAEGAILKNQAVCGGVPKQFPCSLTKQVFGARLFMVPAR